MGRFPDFSSKSGMATVLDTLQKGTTYLEKHGVEDARLNMQILLAHALKCDRMSLYLDFDRVLDEAQLAKLRELTKRRGRGEPLQHLLGTVEFCGRDFLTDARALIPRPETEELVERLSRELRDSGRAGLRILDMGAGSGVIGLSLAADLSEMNPAVTLADVSAEALALAEENRAQLEVAADCVESDLFSRVEGLFDLIVANLPYVPESERTLLSREVRRDPDLALFGGGDAGTAIMERFLTECRAHLAPGGRVAMEFGEGQSAVLAAAAMGAGLATVEIVKDLSGHERFLFAVNPAGPA
jgi:release factor glutamine methyltransferase